MRIFGALKQLLKVEGATLWGLYIWGAINIFYVVVLIMCSFFYFVNFLELFFYVI